MNIEKLKNELLIEAEFVAEDFVQGNFASQSFGGKKWPARKRTDKPGSRRALLVQSGIGKRSVRVSGKGDAVNVSTDKPYMAAHNEGATINHPGGTPYIVVNEGGRTRARFMRKDGSYPKGTKFTKPHTIKLPERRFIGDNPVLRDSLSIGFSKVLKHHLKSFL